MRILILCSGSSAAREVDYGGQRIELDFGNPLDVMDAIQSKDEAYIILRDKMSIVLFDFLNSGFYLREVKDKEILGDDGCSVWCDV